MSGVCCSSGPRGRRQGGVQPVAELVGQHEHVAPAAGVVEHQVRVHARRRVRAERAAALVRADGRVDPALVEEPLGQLAEDRRELVEGAQDELGRVGPVDVDLLVGDRRHAVVVGEPVEAEQVGLQAVPAPRQVVVVAHRRQQRLDRLVAGLVGEVAAGQPVRVGAQAIVDGLVEQQGVEDIRARAQAGLERGGDRLGGGAPDLAVGRHQTAEREVQRRALVEVGQLDADRARQLGEQARPGVAAGQALFGHQPLFGLGEQVRAIAAHRAQVVARRVQAVGGQQLVGALVVEGCPFELEEQELGLDGGPALLHAREQRAVGGVGGVDGEAQHRVRAGPAEQVDDRLELAHGGGEAGPVELADTSSMRFGEACGARVSVVEQTIGTVGPVAVDERIEVPRDVLNIDDGHATSVPYRGLWARRQSDAVPSRSGCSPPRRLPEERRGLRAAGLTTPGPRSLRLGSASVLTVCSDLARVKRPNVKTPHRATKSRRRAVCGPSRGAGARRRGACRASRRRAPSARWRGR